MICWTLHSQSLSSILIDSTNLFKFPKLLIRGFTFSRYSVFVNVFILIAIKSFTLPRNSSIVVDNLSPKTDLTYSMLGLSIHAFLIWTSWLITIPSDCSRLSKRLICPLVEYMVFSSTLIRSALRALSCVLILSLCWRIEIMAVTTTPIQLAIAPNKLASMPPVYHVKRGAKPRVHGIQRSAPG